MALDTERNVFTATHAIRIDTPMASTPSIHQNHLPTSTPASTTTDESASERWCQLSARRAGLLIFFAM